jgi:hypothetical protein
MSEIDIVEQAAREAIDSDIGRDSFMDKIGGPERLLAVIADADRYRWLRDSARVDIGCGSVGYLCFGAAIHGEKWNRMYDENGKPTADEVDAAIDAARTDEGRGE